MGKYEIDDYDMTTIIDVLKEYARGVSSGEIVGSPDHPDEIMMLANGLREQAAENLRMAR